MSQLVNKRNLKFHYSPLRYPGGKTFLYSFFDQIFKLNGIQNITYIEPFAGGAGAALTLLFLEKVEKIIINDLDKAIFSFWKSAIFDSERFIEKILSIPVTIKEWRKQKELYANKTSNEFDLGVATFFLNRTNISGIIEGGVIGGINQEGKWKIDARFKKENLIKKISQLSHYRNRIAVTNKDGLAVVNDYIKMDNTFFYLDPPYFEKGASLYLNHYKKNDHKILADQLNQNANSRWLLTYDNCEEIRSLYPNRRIIDFTLNHNAHRAKKGQELMILSDSIICPNYIIP